MTSNGRPHPTPDEVDIILDGQADAALTAHVDACAQCAEVLAQLREVRTLLGSAGEVEPLPATVAARWEQALLTEPPYPGVDVDPDAIDPSPPRFDLPVALANPTGAGSTAEPEASPASAEGGMTPHAPTVATPAHGTAGTLTPDVPDQHAATSRDQLASGRGTKLRSADSNHGWNGGPTPSTSPGQRQSGETTSGANGRRVRMAFALAAGAALVVGGGAAIFSATRPQTVTSAAASTSSEAGAAAADRAESAARADSASVESGGEAARQYANTDPAEAPAPAAAAPGTGSSEPGAPPAPTDVRALVADGTMTWDGVPDSTVPDRAKACLEAIGIPGPVLATQPQHRSGPAGDTPVQVIVVAAGADHLVLTVQPQCPAGPAPLISRQTVPR